MSQPNKPASGSEEQDHGKPWTCDSHGLSFNPGEVDALAEAVTRIEAEATRLEKDLPCGCANIPGTCGCDKYPGSCGCKDKARTEKGGEL